jgi:hypothetical protein
MTQNKMKRLPTGGLFAFQRAIQLFKVQLNEISPKLTVELSFKTGQNP